MLIYRLFANQDPASYCVISQRVEDGHDFAGGTLPELAGRYYRLPSDPGSGVKSKVARGFTLPAAFRARSAAIARVARDEGCEAIVVFTGDLLNLPAAARASRTTRIPYYVYVCDYYSRQWVNRVFGYVAQRVEPHVLRGAAAVIVPNEFMRDELRREFGVRAQVIHHFCDLSEYGPAPTRPLAGRLNVVYTGAVSPAQSDALQNAARATELMSAEGAAFHLFTGQSADVLRALGVEGQSCVIRTSPHRRSLRFSARRTYSSSRFRLSLRTRAWSGLLRRSRWRSTLPHAVRFSCTLREIRS